MTTTDGVHTIDASTATNPGTRISPVVNIISGYQEVGHQTASDPWYTVDMAVFGGGKGAPAVVKSNPKSSAPTVCSSSTATLTWCR